MSDVYFWIHGLVVCGPCKDHIASRSTYPPEILMHTSSYREVICDWCGVFLDVRIVKA